MSNSVVAPSQEFHNPRIDQCSICKELVNVKDIGPNYEGQLATYSEDKYCTLKCMQNTAETED